MVEITMNGPAKNALGSEMIAWLLERLEAAKGEPVLLTGTGDAFSAGLNLKEVMSLDAGGMHRFLRLLERCMSALYLHPAPTVALVNGHAIAGGCVLALCCDYRVAAADPGLRMGLNEVALGLRFPPRVWHIVRERVPPSSHIPVLLGASLFPPEQALAHGLLDEVSAEAQAIARARLAAFAANPADAYAAAKRALRGASESDLATEEELRRWLAESVPAWTSDLVKSKVLAILKR